jgi:cell division protease FtsH
MTKPKKSKRPNKYDYIALALLALIAIDIGYSYTKSKSDKPIPARIQKNESGQFINSGYTEFLKRYDNKSVTTLTIDSYTWSYQTTDGKSYEFIIPSSLAGANLINDIARSGVEVSTIDPAPKAGGFEIFAIFNFLINILMIMFFGLISVYLIRNFRSMNQSVKFIKPNKIEDRFDEVIGQNAAKQSLLEIAAFISAPERFSALGAKTPRGIVMYGPPGTGKTKLARSFAAETGANFIALSGSELSSPFIGVGQQKIRSLFKSARKKCPCIIFIDEVDSLASKRSSDGINPSVERETNSIINQLLTEMDGFNDRDGIIVIAATNRLEDLDEAILRPGRFDRKVELNLPRLPDRVKLLEHYTRDLKSDIAIDFKVIARHLNGFSGADIQNLCNESAIEAVRQNAPLIRQEHFQSALETIMFGSSSTRDNTLAQENDIVAVHEAGHALAAVLIPNATPFHKATIVGRGNAGGYVLRLPEDDNNLQSKTRINANLVVTMAGRAAEETIFGSEEVTTGASADIAQATREAIQMITSWGMHGDDFVAIRPDKLGRYPDSVYEKAAIIVNEAMAKARDLCQNNKDKIRAIADALKENETIDRDQLQNLIQNKKA